MNGWSTAAHFCCRTTGDDALVGKHGQARGQPGQRLGIVRHHHHRETEFLLQHPEQLDEVLAAIRVETGGGLVENEQLRLQRQGARQSNPLDHAARQLGGHQTGVARFKLDHAEFEQHQIGDHRLVESVQFP
jgi:hypothetical protein